MKFDKEFLLKNQFWVLLCVAVPLALIDLVFLGFIVPGGTAALKKKTDKEHTTIQKFSTLANPRYIEQAQKELAKAKVEEKKVWEYAWLAQEALYTWPGSNLDKQDSKLDENFKQGLFVKAIALHPTDTKAESLTPPEKEERYYGVFHGVILGVAEDNQSISVKALKAKGGVRQFFNPGPNQVKITVVGKDAEKKKFEDLQNYKGFRVVVTYEKGKAFGDELTLDEQQEFAEKYQGQILPILRELGPWNESKEPVVQFKGWVYSENPKELFFLEEGGLNPGAVRQPGGKEGAGGANRGANEFFPFVPKTWKHLRTERYNSTRDAWVFQENLWVMRELFRQLRTVNQEVATFQARGSSGGAEPTFFFENPYWRLELKPLAESKLSVTIKNLIDSSQKIPISGGSTSAPYSFKVQFTEGGKFVKLPPLKSPRLAPKGVSGEVEGKKISDTFTQVFDLQEVLKTSPKKVVAVEQVLSWETAGVKRIDAVHLGTPLAQSHRTFNRPLKSFFPEEKKDDKGEDKLGKKGPGGLEAKGQQDVKVTDNGQVLERYLDVTPQSRRLPVALVLVVDQNQVYRVQAALADCQFRFLTTQVVLNRCPDSMRPVPRADAAPGPLAVRPPQEELTSGANQQETNIELVIYGVITLYERYPPRGS